jgi:2-iminobutanoate/2-iminopropanoate deaminase
MAERVARRRTLEIDGVKHRAPIPMGCRVGSLLHSSAVMGMDPSTGEIPAAGDEQVRCAFANIRRLLDAGDATTDDIVAMSVYLDDDALRPAVDDCWIEMFPDPADRPARHTTRLDLPGNMRVQLEVVAVVEERD